MVVIAAEFEPGQAEPAASLLVGRVISGRAASAGRSSSPRPNEVLNGKGRLNEPAFFAHARICP